MLPKVHARPSVPRSRTPTHHLVASLQIRISELATTRHGSRRLAVILLLSSLVVVAPSSAQSHRRRADCNLAERRYDNPFADHSGWSMRRYEWHAFYATGSIVTAEAVHRAIGLPRWASAVTATVALGILPHVRSGLMLRRYPVNARDWSFDLFTRAAPIFVWSGLRGANWESQTLTATTYAAGYAVLACYASP